MAASTFGLVYAQSVPLTGMQLFGLGVGWNISFIAATAEMADRTSPVERGRLLGFNDLLGALLAATFALLGGFALERVGVVALAFGAAAVVVTCLLFCARGFKSALASVDGFGKLLATGLTAVFALQVFVIVGGVTRVIPLTGVTLPFVSYGGSSIVANLVLLALLLIVSDSARRERRRAGALVGGEVL
jgi:hypothetical protein